MKLVINVPEDTYDRILNKDIYLEDASTILCSCDDAIPFKKELEDIKAEITKEKEEKGYKVWYYENLMEKFDKHCGKGKEWKE